MDENTSRITSLVNELIVRILPPNTPKNVIQNRNSYALRILSSRISINAKQIEDEDTVRACIQKRLQKRAEEQNLTKQTLSGMSLRVQELLMNLNKKKVLKKRMSVCFLLTKISESSKIHFISPVDTFINDKDPRKSKATAPLAQRGGMEIEQSTTSGLGASAVSTQSNASKVVQKVKTTGTKTVSEQELLRDTLFAFQGIDGRNVYYSAHDDGFVIKPTLSLSDPVRKMVLQLCEMGWLYKKVVNFIEEANIDSRGLVHQSLCYALKEELNEYYRLIAVLENLRDTDDEENRSAFLAGQQPGSKSLNLRKMYLWSLEPFERLKWMSIFCDACKKIKGSVILSTIYGYTKQGSPSVQILVNRILKQVLAPFSNFLKQWVYNGELADLYGEFFISINPYIKDDDLWHNRYVLNREMIPGFMDLQLAEKILTTGKSVNFMRKCCLATDWYLNIDFIDLSSAVVSNVNQTLNFTEFKEWALRTNEMTCKALLNVMFDKFRLVQHFKMLKRFLLFGQGDFIQYLMDLLIGELSKPATSIYKHNLLAILETAIRSSNAQFIENDLLNRIDIKLLEPSPGDNGWDIFSLTYKVESPLSTLFSAKLMNGYLKIFNFLWRIKRIEHSLNLLWQQHMKGAALMDRMQGFRVHIHKCNLLRNEMNHFVGNLFNYLMVEVVEGAWTTFMEEVQQAKDLDEMIGYHEKFVTSILEKGLLTPKNEKLYKQMVKMFDLIFRFKCTQEVLLTSIQGEDHRRAARRNRRDMMEILEEDDLDDRSQASSDLNRDDTLEIESLGNVSMQRNAMRVEYLNNLQTVWKDYQGAFMELMNLLKDDSLGGKLRFLSFKLDFNEFYSSLNPQNMMMRERRIEDFRINTRSNNNDDNTGGGSGGRGGRGGRGGPGGRGGRGGPGSGDGEYYNPRESNNNEYYNPRESNYNPRDSDNNDYYGQESHESYRPEPKISPPRFGQGDQMLTEDEEEFKQNVPLPHDSYSTMRKSPPTEYSRPTAVEDIGVNLRQPGGSTVNLSSIQASMDRLGDMLRNKTRPGTSGSRQFDPRDSQFGSEGLESNSFLKSYQDDQPYGGGNGNYK